MLPCVTPSTTLGKRLRVLLWARLVLAVSHRVFAVHAGSKMEIPVPETWNVPLAETRGLSLVPFFCSALGCSAGTAIPAALSGSRQL
jgi:hypothetical protein